MLKETKTILVVGIGNPLRSDDGVGPYLAELIEEESHPGVSIRIEHQLHIELLEDAQAFDSILLIDASYLKEGLSIKKVIPLKREIGSSSHHLTPEFFLSLGNQLYQSQFNLFLCCIQGKNFEVGDQFSQEVQEIIPRALDKIHEFLKEN